MSTDSPKARNPKAEDVQVPRRVGWEVRDLVHPIVLRRSTLYRAGTAIALVIFLGVAVWMAFLRPPSGKALLAGAVEAAGGMERWNAIETGRFTRVHRRYDVQGNVESEETETIYFRKGTGDFRLVIESETDIGRVIIGRDDHGYWATRNGVPVNPIGVARDLGMMCDSEYCTPDCGASMAFYRFSLPFKLTDPGVIPANAGDGELNGVPVNRLEITFDPEVGSDRWLLFIDKDTRLIRKIEHFSSVDGDTPPQEIYWSDHKPEGGITFSHRNAYYRSNGTKLEEYVITNADFSTPVPERTFVRPENRGA